MVGACIRLTVPALQNERCQLAFLSEQYLDLLAYRPPKEYKPAKASEVAIQDREYVLEVLARISNSLTDFLHKPGTPSRLTGPETTYYTVVSLLAAALLTGISSPRAEPVPKTLSLLTSSIKTALTGLRESFPAEVEDRPQLPAACGALADMHTMAYLRETALAMRHSAAFVAAFHDKELARDRSGRSGLHRDVLAEMRALGEMAGKALAEVKGHVQWLKEALAESGWLDRLLDVVFGGEEVDEEAAQDEVAKAFSRVVGGRAAAEEWAAKVIESWRDGVRGWGMVRME